MFKKRVTPIDQIITNIKDILGLVIHGRMKKNEIG